MIAFGFSHGERLFSSENPDLVYSIDSSAVLIALWYFKILIFKNSSLSFVGVGGGGK